MDLIREPVSRGRRRSTSGHRRDSENLQLGSSRRLRSLSPERRESTSEPSSKSHDDAAAYNPYNTVHNLGMLSIARLPLQPYTSYHHGMLSVQWPCFF